MGTEGKFFVKNDSKKSVSGNVNYHKRAESLIEFKDLKPGDSTDSVKFHSGAGTKDTWYYDYSQGEDLRLGDKECAFYSKDQSGDVEITIGDNYFKVTPHQSGSCIKNF
jgi:hypothetical protein